MRIIIYFLMCLIIPVPVFGQTVESTSNDVAIISDLVCRKGQSSVLNKKMANLQLKKILWENLYFNKNSYHEFGDLRTVFSEEIITDVFNKHQVELFINQLEKDSLWQNSPLESLPISPRTDGKILSISKPVYSKNGYYSLIYYEIEIKEFMIFKRGVLLYKKSNGDWNLEKEFFHAFS